MRLPRLIGARVALVPVERLLAVAVCAGEPVAGPLAELGLTAAPGWPHDDTPSALQALAEHGDADGWLVVADGVVVGECGWRGGPDARGDVEIGYGLAGAARGRGLGTEAVGVLVAWVEQQADVRRVTARVQVGNEASRRLLRRLGFAEQDDGAGWLLCVRDLARPSGSLRIAGRHVC